MLLEYIRFGGREDVLLRAQDTIGEDAVVWEFRAEDPSRLVLAFLNQDYAGLLTEENAALQAAQLAYLEESMSRGGCPSLRHLIDHVLVCTQEAGFSPPRRLAAYQFVESVFDVSRLTRYAEKAALEAALAAPEENAALTRHWTALLREQGGDAVDESALFEALLADAEAEKYPLHLRFCRQYTSFANLLKACAAEMIFAGELLKRCQACGRYFLAEASDSGYCTGPSPTQPHATCREAAKPAPPQPLPLAEDIARLYKQIYNLKANRAKRSGETRLAAELEEFKAEAKRWRSDLRGGGCTQEEYYAWLLQLK
ncbi:MAG: DUF6076 domain-containing protein [Oscillospiraceae bacterium]|jgi:hypothetical protein|nr:DUF6076 domain-containing protein [Oscillospiraceae bacterium]